MPMIYHTLVELQDPESLLYLADAHSRFIAECVSLANIESGSKADRHLCRLPPLVYGGPDEE